MKRTKAAAARAQSAVEILEEKQRAVAHQQWLAGLAVRLLATALSVYLLFGVIFGVGRVEGDSMEPAIRAGDLVLFLRLGGYRDGDVVLIRKQGRRDLLKRVVAIPGETVEIDDAAGTLLVNGQLRPEPYIYAETHAKAAVGYPLTLAEGEYFVLGDNRENSLDSRNYGPVSAADLEGKMIACLRMG